jgi:hypothetical protein
MEKKKMIQPQNRPIPKFEGADDFKIKRNQAATIVLPLVGIVIYRDNSDGTHAKNMSTDRYQTPVRDEETRFNLTVEEMTAITAPDIDAGPGITIKFIVLQENYSAESGEGTPGYGEKSAAYEVID